MDKLIGKSNRFATVCKAVTLSALLVCTYAAANIFNNRLQLFNCKNEEDALSCRNCIATAGLEFEYKVNVSNQIVLRNHWVKGEFTGSYPLNGCKVVDSSNWTCDETEGRSTSSWRKETMTGGRASITNPYVTNSQVNSCAK